MAGDKRQRFWLPAPVFHKLTRQLDRIPRHPADAGNARHVDARQHVMQAVSELMEQRGDFVMGKQRRFAVHRTVKVTGQVGNRFLQAAVRFTHHTDAVVHPGAAAFVFTRVEIEVEAAAQFAIFVVEVKEAHVRMPDVDILALFSADAVNAFYHLEQAVDRAFFREVGSQLFVADGVEVLFLFFAIVSEIPRL